MADPYNDAVRRIVTTKAASRFTKTPIKITSTEKYLNDSNSSGAYFPDQNEILVNLQGNSPTYSDVSNTIHHEDIHSLLNKNNLNEPTLSWSDPTKPFLERIVDAFIHSPTQRAWSAWDNSNRGGSGSKEIPAYMGAYSNGQLNGISPADRQNYLNRLLPNLPPKVAELFMRIAQSNDASQRF